MGTAGEGKFKVGDRVAWDNYLDDGKTLYGTVDKVDGSRVHCSDWTIGCKKGWDDASKMRFGYLRTAIVAVIENGTPKPNARPRIHDTEASATTEAERLAKLNPGQTFGVFVQTTARVADVTVRVA